MTHKIGSGSFAVVSKGRHRVHGTEVAIKEIATDNLNRKLQESLESEIAILKRANHPNIIRLLEIVKSPDKIFLILEYCAGGDLSDYIRRNGRVKESTARHFMRQLGAGLQVLRANNLIHRDLKPQNLLLSTKDKSAVLKIADFGFARSLQPQGLAETLCGSPLYMAPEILQFQKYDAKADLWSVGAILFELITGRPPFGGQNHVQLLRNIEKTEAVIPSVIAGELTDSCTSLVRLLLRRNPVERLSFEEFFHHSFLDLQSSLRWCRFKGTEIVEVSRSEAVLTSAGRKVTGARDSNTGSGVRNIEVSSETTPSSGQCTDDCLPFALDEDHQNMSDIRRASSSGSEKRGNGAPVERGSQERPNTRESTEKFVKNDESSMVESNVHPERGAAMSGVTDTSGPTATGDFRKAVTGDASGVGRGGSSSDSRRTSGGSRGQTEVSGNARFGRIEGRDCDGGSSREGSVREGLSTDSMECIEREYVVVDVPLKMSSEPVSPRRPPRISWTRSQTTPVRRARRSPSPSPAVPARSPSVPVSVPVPISAGASGGLDPMGSRGSTPSSYDSAEVIDAPSPHPPTRLASLQRSARLVNVVAMDKLEAQQPFEALSLQLLCLAIWRQILEVCHSWAVSAAEGNSPPPFQEVRGGGGPTAMSVSLGVGYGGGPEEGGEAGGQESEAARLCEILEREFLSAVEKAEEVSRHVGPREVSEMPDAVELVYQSALAVGRASAVEELMGNVSNAAVGYAKASALFYFLLVEAPTLPLVPSYELSPSDRYRLRRYAESVITRQNQCSAARLQFSQQSRHTP